MWSGKSKEVYSWARGSLGQGFFCMISHLARQPMLSSQALELSSSLHISSCT